MSELNADWKVFRGKRTDPEDTRPPEPHSWKLPTGPSWRPYGEVRTEGESRREQIAETFQISDDAINMVNAAIYLRRPLLITGKPGTGKSSLVYAVARELQLGEVLYWPITTRTTLAQGLYDYDAIGRLQDANLERDSNPLSVDADPESREARRRKIVGNIENYITLGPLGTALIPSKKPRVLLIDEIDKSDIDLPNDLLTVLEEGRFKIRELERIKGTVSEVTVRTAYENLENPITGNKERHTIENGVVTCSAFPLVIMTSNGERDFPPPFLRRCLRLRMKPPSEDELAAIVRAHLGPEIAESDRTQTLITNFLQKQKTGILATDQLLNAVFMVARDLNATEDDKQKLVNALLRSLGSDEEG